MSLADKGFEAAYAKLNGHRNSPPASLRNEAGRGGDRLETPGVLLSEVVPEQVRWLWEGRIARGKLTVLDGDPGTGKSAATTDLAARQSVGKPWPDGAECEAGGVVILSAEDGLSDTIRPRLDAAGGDPSRVFAVSTVLDAEGNERQIAIPDDLHVIEAAIERVGAVLVIIDPLMAFLSGTVNSHRDQDVRRALAPLARLAERTGAAILVVRHLNKGAGGSALYRGGGSIGIVGAARSAFLVAKHPEEEDLRVLAPLKSNLAPPAPSLVFGLSSTEGGAVRVEWKGESNLNAEALLSAPTDHEERSALSEAQEFLRDVLADGPVPASDARKEASSAGISTRTLDRARQSLGVVAKREGVPGRRGGGTWFWRLPEVNAANPEGWRSKSAAGRGDGEKGALLNQERTPGIRLPNAEAVGGANGHGNLNRSLHAGLGSGESAPSTRGQSTSPRMADNAGGAPALTVEEVARETRRSGSGPARALATYLEKPNDERLGWLTGAVLHAKGLDTGQWKRHAAAVEEAAGDTNNHPLDCECDRCA